MNPITITIAIIIILIILYFAYNKFYGEVTSTTQQTTVVADTDINTIVTKSDEKRIVPLTLGCPIERSPGIPYEISYEYFKKRYDEQVKNGQNVESDSDYQNFAPIDGNGMGSNYDRVEDNQYYRPMDVRYSSLGGLKDGPLTPSDIHFLKVDYDTNADHVTYYENGRKWKLQFPR